MRRLKIEQQPVQKAAGSCTGPQHRIQGNVIPDKARKAGPKKAN